MQTSRSIFLAWMDEMDLSATEAADMLGKSHRMIGYYLGGRNIPRDTIYLMDAVTQGYCPPHLRVGQNVRSPEGP